ncbi:MAG: molybdate ABC transporter substrate-binding protein, partial [Pseudomonadota bacterium]
MRFGIRLSVIIATMIGLAAGPAVARDAVTIFAAASLKTVLDKIAATLPGQVTIAYGGSATMARQLVQGAEVDIIILAHTDWMDWAEAQGALATATRCNLVGNKLVLAGGDGQAELAPETAGDIIERLDGGRLAMGNMQSVPAGQYARAWFDANGWLADMRPHLAEVQNVRLALSLVGRGEAALGIVYASDVAADPTVRTVYRIPENAHDPIRYPMALTQDAGPDAPAIAAAIATQID